MMQLKYTHQTATKISAYNYINSLYDNLGVDAESMIFQQVADGSRVTSLGGQVYQSHAVISLINTKHR